MARLSALLLAAFVVAAAAECYQQCPPDLLPCGVACYSPLQYTCVDNTLCAVGTSACGGVCIQDCGYFCTGGNIQLKDKWTCPRDCSGSQDGKIATCGDVCIDPTTTACFNDTAVPLTFVPNSDSSCVDVKGCTFVLQNVGQLWDGQLRLDYGPGAFDVSFNISQGVLVDNRGQTCYIAGNQQLQCNYVPQTNDTTPFCVTNNGFLSYQGSPRFYSCPVGTGGYNIYNEVPALANCAPIALLVTKKNCTRSITTYSSSTASSPVTSPSTTSLATTVQASTLVTPPRTCIKKSYNPFFWWSFDTDFQTGQSSTTCTDQSGNGRHGRCTSSGHRGRGKYNSGALFSTSNRNRRGQQTSISASDCGSIGKSFSIAKYINFHGSFTGVLTIASTSSWSLQFDAGRKTVTFYAAWRSSTTWLYTPDADGFFHFAFTVDQNGYAKCYKNGEQVDQTKRCDVPRFYGSIDLCGHDSHFKGTFDEVFVFDYCLTKSQVCGVRDNRCD